MEYFVVVVFVTQTLLGVLFEQGLEEVEEVVVPEPFLHVQPGGDFVCGVFEELLDFLGGFLLVEWAPLNNLENKLGKIPPIPCKLCLPFLSLYFWRP